MPEEKDDQPFDKLAIDEESRSKLHQLIGPDETIELVIRASIGLGATWMGINQPAIGAAVCTNKRIVFAGVCSGLKSMYGGLCIPLDRVVSVTASRGFLFGGLRVDCVHGQQYELKDVSPKRDARKFADAVTQLLKSQDRTTNLFGIERYGYFSLLTGSREATSGTKVTPPITGADLDYVNARMRECGVFGLKNERAALAGRLKQGEAILSAIRCSFTRTIGPDSDVFQQLSYSGLVVVTDGRLCLLARDKNKDDMFVEIPLARVESAAISESKGGSSVRVVCAGFPTYKVDTIWDNRRTREFAQAADSQIQKVKPRKSTADEPSANAGREPTPSNLYVAKRFDELGLHGNAIKGEREMLAKSLDPGESLVYAISGTYSENLGQYNRPFLEEAHIGCVALTDRRVLFLDKGILGNEEIAEVPFPRIESVKHSKGPMWGGLHVNCVGGSVYKIEVVSPRQAAEDFADLLRAELKKHATKSAHLTPDSAHLNTVADELTKLKGLLDTGAIDQSEFDVLKGALISRAS